MRNLLILLSGLFLLVFGCATDKNVNQKPQTQEKKLLKPAFPQYTNNFGPIVTYSDTALSQATIVFYTTNPEVSSLTVINSEGETVFKDSEPAQFHIFTVTLNEPNIEYQIGSSMKDLNGIVGSIRIPLETPYTFAVYGDTRTGYNDHERLCQTIHSFAPDFIINTGDLVDDGGNKSQWGRFFKTLLPLSTNTVYLPVEGNHDNHPWTWKRVFFTPNFDYYYYSYDLPETKLIVLDTDIVIQSNSAQMLWLENELSNTEATWKIVTFHRPPFSSSHHHMDKERPSIVSNIVPLLKKYGVKLVFNGHDHLYERNQVEKAVYITTGGGGAPQYPSTKVNPYSVKIITNELHFLLVTVHSDSLEIRMMNEKKKVLDEITITQDEE